MKSLKYVSNQALFILLEILKFMSEIIVVFSLFYGIGLIVMLVIATSLGIPIYWVIGLIIISFIYYWVDDNYRYKTKTKITDLLDSHGNVIIKNHKIYKRHCRLTGFEENFTILI